MRTLNKFAIKIIHKYQEHTKNSIHRCRHLPSCSNYALDAYKEYNFIYASVLTLFRIVRCNPLVKPKYDPIPKYKNKHDS